MNYLCANKDIVLIVNFAPAELLTFSKTKIK